MCSFFSHFCFILLILFVLFHHFWITISSRGLELFLARSSDSDTSCTANLICSAPLRKKKEKNNFTYLSSFVTAEVCHLIMSVWRRPTLFRSWSLRQISKGEGKRKPSLVFLFSLMLFLFASSVGSSGACPAALFSDCKKCIYFKKIK